MAEFKKMDLASADLVAERIEQLKQLLPEVATEGGIDFDKLRLVLGDEVDEGTERFAFTWPGKTDAIRQSQIPSTATLRPCPEESVNWDDTENLYIEGDNLEVLKLLQHSYHGRVKLIYIDPPYNTGHDFVYKDKFGDTIKNYREQAGLAGQSNSDTSGRYHSDWCSMMYPRLRLARELLSEDGVLFVSIDAHENSNLRLMLDELFGAPNFISEIACVNKPSGRSDDKYIATAHESILIYRKSEALRLGGFEPEQHIVSRYTKTLNGRLYRDEDLRKRGNGDERVDRPNMFYPFFYSETTGELRVGSLDERTPEGFIRIVPMKTNEVEGRWRWGRDTALGDLEHLHAVYMETKGQWSVFEIQYLDERGSVKPMSVWAQRDVNSERGTESFVDLGFNQRVFENPKPVGTLSRIIKIATDADSLVMDFFSGSATSAQAIFAVNASDAGHRRLISVQLPEACASTSVAAQSGFANICEIGKERIRRAGAKIAAEIEESNKQLKLGEEPKPIPDIGFRVLKLDESGIERPKPGELLLDVVKPDRTDEDIIFEMMLKWGLELTLPIEKVDAAGYLCYSVAYGELVCCLADGLNMQVLDAIADMEPRRVLMLDRILDDTTKLNAVQAFKRVEEKTGREVELRTV